MTTELLQLKEPVEIGGKGGLVLPNRIFQGPMEGVTEGTYVSAMASRGWVTHWWTPFIRISTGVPRKGKLLGRIKPYLDTGTPVIAQIMGTDGDLLAGAAARLAELGVAAVDLNCACPSHNVIGSHAGGYRLKNPDWIGETLTKIRTAVKGRCAVSVKLRMGYETPAEFEAVANAVRDAAPDMVAVHFRTVKEGYGTVAGGSERLASVRRMLPNLFLVGCGDVFSPEDAARMVGTTGVDGVAAARGLIRNPRLLWEIRRTAEGGHPEPISEAEKLAFLNDLWVENTARCRGYVLQSAVQMLPAEHPFIANLKTRPEKISPNIDE